MKRTPHDDMKIRNTRDCDHDADKETDQVAEDVATRDRLRYGSGKNTASTDIRHLEETQLDPRHVADESRERRLEHVEDAEVSTVKREVKPDE